MVIDKSVMRKKLNIPWGWIIGLGSAVIAGAAFKIWLLLAGVVPFNSDEAIVALMAQHILEGERPVFFYGQWYMGSLDAYLISGVYKLTGAQVWGVRLVQIFLYSLTIITTGILAKQLTGKWKVGVLAAWLLALPNVSTTLYTTVSIGGYGEMLLIGNLILITTVLIINKANINHEKLFFASWFGLGFLIGFGLWVFGLTLVYSIPALIYLVWMSVRSASNYRLTNNLFPFPIERKEIKHYSRTWGAAIIGGVFGAFPWWAAAKNTGLLNLFRELSGSAIAGVESLSPLEQILQHIINLGLFGPTVILGLRPPWEIRWLALPLAPLVLVFWIGVIIFAVRKTASDFRHNPGEGDFSHAPLLSAVVISIFAGFILSPFGADPSGRYFLPVGVVMAVFAAQAVWKWQPKWGKYIWSAVGVLFIFHIWGTIEVARGYPPGVTTQFDAVTQINHEFDQELIDFLVAQGETRGYTNYWVAYPLAFHSDEKIVFIPKLPYHPDLRYTSRDNRFQPYDQLVNQSDRVAYITTGNDLLDDLIRERFSENGIRWEEINIGDFQVYFQLSRRVTPEEIGLIGGEG